MAIEQAMAQLSPEHRMAALLFLGEGLSLAEAARAMSIPLGTAKSRIFNARKQLQILLRSQPALLEERKGK